MKILFVPCYVDNHHFIDIMKQSLDKNLLNWTYDFICLNDAAYIKNGEENFLKICDITENGLTPEQIEIIEKTYFEKWNEFHKKFVGIKYTKQDLLHHGLRV